MTDENIKNRVDRKIITIIIPVFNGLKYTKSCLFTLNRLLSGITANDIEFEIVVVNDGSSDGTAEWIRDNYLPVHLLHGNGSLWWSGGINKGVDFALNTLNTEYILWWNNDIQPAADYFEQLIKLIDSIDVNIIIGSKIFILNENKIWGMGGKFNPHNGRRFMYGEQQKDNDDYGRPIFVDWFPGMGTLLHRKVFDKIGLLDEKNFPQYHGDSDFTFRARKAGFKLIAFPQLVIYNDNTNTGLKHGGKSDDLYKSLTSIKSNFNLNKDILFYKKHSSSPLAYFLLFNKYFRYVGGFYKWKILNAFGISKSENGS